MSDAKTYEGLQTVVFLVGLYEGVVPLIAKTFDLHPFLALPLKLPDPAWWIVSVAVIVVSVIALDLLDRAKKRAG